MGSESYHKINGTLQFGYAREKLLGGGLCPGRCKPWRWIFFVSENSMVGWEVRSVSWQQTNIPFKLWYVHEKFLGGGLWPGRCRPGAVYFWYQKNYW